MPVFAMAGVAKPTVPLYFTQTINANECLTEGVLFMPVQGSEVPFAKTISGNIRRAERHTAKQREPPPGLVHHSDLAVQCAVSVRSSHLDWVKVSNRCPPVFKRTPVQGV